MTKRFILIGNKPLRGDYSWIDTEYDKIFHINKMDNLGNSGRRVSGLYLGAYPDFSAVKGGRNREYFKEAKEIYMLPIPYRFFWDWSDYISAEQFAGIKLIDFDEARRYFGAATTSTVNILWLLVNGRIEEFKGYEVTLAGLDVEGRAELLKTGAPWAGTGHAQAGAAEERWLRELIDSGQIKYLDLE